MFVDIPRSCKFIGPNQDRSPRIAATIWVWPDDETQK
jgi:hypothetical protein